LAARGEHTRSVKAYKAALAINPNGVAAHLGLGNAYYEIDALDAALVHLEKARALAPDDPQAFVLLGAAYQSAGRTRDAVDAYERYLQLAPTGRFARDVRGILKRLSR
jgi:tetratricopeptide (TPR) repeat protein